MLVNDGLQSFLVGTLGLWVVLVISDAIWSNTMGLVSVSWFQYRVGNNLDCRYVFGFTKPIYRNHVLVPRHCFRPKRDCPPGLSLIGGGYFPGLVTSPLVGVLGVLLARRLYRT